jgi:hypothetical protein
MDEDLKKLNDCLDILGEVDLGLPLVWLWTWSVIKDILDEDDEGIISIAKDDEAWDLLKKAVAGGYGFTLEYGSDTHYEMVRSWALEAGLIKYFEEGEG